MTIAKCVNISITTVHNSTYNMMGTADFYSKELYGSQLLPRG